MKINVEYLEKERERRGETKTKYSARLGLSVYGYNRVLVDESTTMKRVNIMADALHIDPLDLLVA
jgi:hypothetical protein